MIRKTLVAAITLAFCGVAGAAGLGRINVMSALGQPLRAEVQITATPEELDTMVARLASAEAFKRANVEYLGIFSDIKLSIEKRANAPVLRIATDRPFNEPYVDLLVDLNWAGGRLLREFTFLLDPAERPTQLPLTPPAGAISPAPRIQATPLPATPPARREAAAPASTAAAPAAVARPAPERSAERYTVERGDTLSSIASEHRAGEVSQEQMLAALYRSNADAFIGGNINRLRAGRILKLPTTGEAAKIPRSEAREIVLKASNFENYSQNLAAAAAAGPARDTGAGQSATGRIAPRVEEKAAGDAASRDKVKVTAAEAPGTQAAAASAQNRIQSLQDEVASRDKALQEANSRVADLEKNVRELEKLVALKNQGLAEAQKQAASSLAVSSVATSLAAPAAELGAASAPQAVAEPVAAVSEVAPVAAESAPVIAASAPVVAQSAPKPVVITETVVEPEEDFLGRHQLALIGGLGILAVLGYVISRQRRKRAADDQLGTQLTDASTTSPNSVFGSAGGQTVDTGGTSLLHTDFSQSGMSAIDTDEGVDPVAEADVYMAYGRDAQAEEILLDALKHDPSRTAIYAKLLEIYAQREDQKSFESVATDLYARTQGAGDDWAKAAALGARIDPSNPLYTTQSASAAPVAVAAGLGAAALAASAPQPAAAPAPEAVLDLPLDDLGPQTVPGDEEIPEGVVSFGAGEGTIERATWTLPGSVSQLAEEPVTPVVEPVADVGRSSDLEPLNLDFNLDLEPSSDDATRTRLDLREAVEEEPDFEAESMRTQPSFTETSVPLEFDIGFADETAAEAEPAVVEPVVATAPASLPDEFDLGIESASDDRGLAEVDLEKTNFDNSLLDFDFDLGEERAAPEPAAGLPVLPQVAEPSPVTTIAHEPIQDNIDVDEEVATKLELARAYEEMGDAEGARELLEEVIADGGESQKQQARAMLERMV